MKNNNEKIVLDLKSGRLLKNHVEVPLKPKIFQLLEFLTDRPNTLVSTKDILETLWPDSYVSKGIVREYIHDLRIALSDQPKSPRYIETVHGRGYRYIGNIEIIESDNKQSTSVYPPQPVIAVLPLKNLSGIKKWDYFADGITNDIITDLTRFSDLAVIANNSSSIYKNQSVDLREVGHELKADYVLEGSIQIHEERIRTIAQLIETKNATHVWSERYTRKCEDLFKIKDDIVQQVSSAIGGFDGAIFRAERSKLDRNSPSSLKVYEMYLRGFELQEQFTKKSNQKAIDILEQAVKLDPHYSRPWIILSWAYYLAGEYNWLEKNRTVNFKQRQEECIKKAVELDPTDPVALKEMAILQMHEGDIEGAKKLLKKALRLGQNFPSLLINSARIYYELTSDKDGAIAMIDNAYRLNPVSPRKWYLIQQVRLSYFTREFEITIDTATKSATDFPETLYFTAFALAQLGHIRKAASTRIKFHKLYPNYNFKRRVKELTLIRKQSIDLFWDGFKKAGFDAHYEI